jgi:hypothetical protein
MTAMFLLSAHSLYTFQKLQSFWKWGKGMDIHPVEKTSFTTQYKEAFLKYVENEYCAKYQHVLVNKPENITSNNLIPSALASGSGQSFLDTYDLSSDDEEY